MTVSASHLSPARPARPPRPGRVRRLAVADPALPLLAALAACAGNAGAGDEVDGTAPVDFAGGTPAETLRLGYFANVTHAPALAAVSQGFLEQELADTELETQVFNAGPAALEALVAGAIDAAYLGPNPAINGYVRSEGEVLRIVAGSTSGGAQLVVQPDIGSPADLAGKNLATPQLGNTQDVALRAWLEDNGLETNRSGGGDVGITPTENAQILQLFQEGQIDGAWVPEPWASRLVLEAGGEVLVDEKDLWPQGRFATTQLAVATDFLREHPQTVEALIRANVAAIDWINENGDAAQAEVNASIAEAIGKPVPDEAIDRAFENLQFTPDPIADSLQRSFDDSVDVGISRPASLAGIYDLRLLNKVLEKHGRPTVSAAGLGEE